MKIEKQHNVPNIDKMSEKELYAFSQKYKNCMITYAVQLVGEKYKHKATQISEILAGYAGCKYCLLLGGIDSFTEEQNKNMKKRFEENCKYYYNRIPLDLRW